MKLLFTYSQEVLIVTLNNDAVTKFIYCLELLGEMSDVSRGPIV